MSIDSQTKSRKWVLILEEFSGTERNLFSFFFFAAFISVANYQIPWIFLQQRFYVKSIFMNRCLKMQFKRLCILNYVQFVHFYASLIQNLEVTALKTLNFGNCELQIYCHFNALRFYVKSILGNWKRQLEATNFDLGISAIVHAWKFQFWKYLILDTVSCSPFVILQPFRFYVKSILTYLESQNLPIRKILYISKVDFGKFHPWKTAQILNQSL